MFSLLKLITSVFKALGMKGITVTSVDNGVISINAPFSEIHPDELYGISQKLSNGEGTHMHLGKTSGSVPISEFTELPTLYFPGVLAKLLTLNEDTQDSLHVDIQNNNVCNLCIDHEEKYIDFWRAVLDILTDSEYNYLTPEAIPGKKLYRSTFAFRIKPFLTNEEKIINMKPNEPHEQLLSVTYICPLAVTPNGYLIHNDNVTDYRVFDDQASQIIVSKNDGNTILAVMNDDNIKLWKNTEKNISFNDILNSAVSFNVSNVESILLMTDWMLLHDGSEFVAIQIETMEVSPCRLRVANWLDTREVSNDNFKITYRDEHTGVIRSAIFAPTLSLEADDN